MDQKEDVEQEPERNPHNLERTHTQCTEKEGPKDIIDTKRRETYDSRTVVVKKKLR